MAVVIRSAMGASQRRLSLVTRSMSNRLPLHLGRQAILPAKKGRVAYAIKRQRLFAADQKPQMNKQNARIITTTIRAFFISGVITIVFVSSVTIV